MSLRRIHAEDLALILSWRNAPEVRRYMYSSKVISMQEHRAWFERLEVDDRSSWLIYEEAVGDPKGVVYFTELDEVKKSAFWGFYTAPGCQPGTGTRLGLQALDHAFTVLSLHKLNGEVLATNVRSISFHEKLGFAQEGIFRDAHSDGQNYIDVIRFGVLEHEWRAKRPLIEASAASYGS